MTVSVNRKERTATITTYYEDGIRCGKYRAYLTREDTYYYENNATWNDWVCLTHVAELDLI